MTDQMRTLQPTSDTGQPSGGLSIDFSADTGAVPIAAAVAPIAFAPEPTTAPGGPGSAASGADRT